MLSNARLVSWQQLLPEVPLYYHSTAGRRAAVTRTSLARLIQTTPAAPAPLINTHLPHISTTTSLPSPTGHQHYPHHHLNPQPR